MRIYLAQQIDTNFFKIGVTKKDPTIRIKELQIGNASELILIASYETVNDFKLEASLHAYYKLKRTNGEWFELDNEDLELFLDTCQKLDNNLNLLKQYQNPFF